MEVDTINSSSLGTTMGGHKQRRSNLELYRILVMMLIVAHHYVVNSGLLDVMHNDPMSGRSLYLYLIGMWGKTGINCFVLITGYFMCKSHITVKKFLKLLLEILFYNIVVWAVFIGIGYEPFSLKVAMKVLSPIQSVTHDFTSCFLIFYLLIPFLNILIQNLDKRMYIRLIGLCLFTYTILGTIPKFDVSFNYVTWFCILYFIASYIRMYGLFTKIKNSQWGILTALTLILAYTSVIGVNWINVQFGVNLDCFELVADSNAIFAVIVSVCSFMYFKDLPIKQSKLINTISASTFGVLCIHANSDTMRHWLWKDVVNCIGQYSSEQLVLLSLVSIFCIFFSCIIIDYIRIHTLEKWTFGFVDKQLAKFS